MYDIVKKMLKGDRSNELFEELMSYPAKSLYAISTACELHERVERVERELRGRMSSARIPGLLNECMLELVKLLDRRVKVPRGEDERSYWEGLANYLRDGVDVVRAARERWTVLRREVDECIEGYLSGGMEGMLSDSSGLSPLVSKLQRRAVDAVDEIEGVEVLKMYKDLLRLQGEFSGELKRDVSLNVSADDAFKAIVEMGRSGAIESIPAEYELLE